MKKISVLSSIVFAIIITSFLLYYLQEMLSRASVTITNNGLFCTFVAMVLWCLACMIIYIFRLNKTIKDVKGLLEVVVENQLQHEIDTEKLHKNTRVMLYEAITEGGSNEGNRRKIKVVARK